MREYHEIKEMLCKELKEYARKGELSAGSLDVLHKLTDTIKNIDKIEMLEGDGYSRRGSYDGGGSYDSYGDEDSYRRGYSRDGSYYSNDGGSYEGGNSGRRGYSRTSEKERLARKLKEMMNYSQNEEEREAYRKTIRKLEEE